MAGPGGAGALGRILAAARNERANMALAGQQQPPPAPRGLGAAVAANGSASWRALEKVVCADCEREPAVAVLGWLVDASESGGKVLQRGASQQPAVPTRPFCLRCLQRVVADRLSPYDSYARLR